MGLIVFYFLIWILPLVQHPLWSATIGPLSVFEYFGLISLIWAIFRISAHGKLPPFFSTWVTRAFFLLYVMAFLSLLGKEGPGLHLSDSSFVIFTSSLSIFVLTLTLVDTLTRLRWTILVLIGSYAWASLYVIREWQVGSAVWVGFRPGWIVGVRISSRRLRSSPFVWLFVSCKENSRDGSGFTALVVFS